MKKQIAFFFLVGTALLFASLAHAEPRASLSKTEYVQRLRGMWLAQSIANWTGLQTEGKRNEPPFFTSADWGKAADFFLETDEPWGSDDDTDIEYIYLHLMKQHKTPFLNAQQIVKGWQDFIRGEDMIWVSNLASLRLMRRGVLPPATGYGSVNTLAEKTEVPEGPTPNYLMIDAQLTTEFFGAIAPGMPEYALKIADLPIRTTSGSYATHASQHFMLMYSFAPIADPDLSPRQKTLWVALEARKFLPSTSKTADIFDFMLQNFIRDCPSEEAAGCSNWERARDRIYERYQNHAAANGFRYFHWYDSSVNYATGLLALFYGQGDLKKTIKIGTLSGWDSDNGTATMGGLLGLMNGYEWVRAQFPGVEISDRYQIYRTRSRSLPDYLSRDKEAEDTFELMAARMIEIVEMAVQNAGGRVIGSEMKLPSLPKNEFIALTPTHRDFRASANNSVRARGGVVRAESSTGEPGVEAIADGAENDYSGRERAEHPKDFVAHGAQVTLTVSYDREVPLKRLRFVEGDHGGGEGQFASLNPEIKVKGYWLPLAVKPSQKLSQKPYQIIDWILPQMTMVEGVRLTGPTKVGSASAIEIDAMAE